MSHNGIRGIGPRHDLRPPWAREPDGRPATRAFAVKSNRLVILTWHAYGTWRRPPKRLNGQERHSPAVFGGRWWFRTTDLRLVRAKKTTLLPATIRKGPGQTAKTISRLATRSYPFVRFMWHVRGTRSLTRRAAGERTRGASNQGPATAHSASNRVRLYVDRTSPIPPRCLPDVGMLARTVPSSYQNVAVRDAGADHPWSARDLAMGAGSRRLRPLTE